MKTIAITDVRISKCFRGTWGDIALLSNSIVEIGLLHPIVLDVDNRLISGARRIAAFKSLGRDRIPCFVAQTIDDATKRLIAERDENTCREGLPPSVAVAIATR